MKFYLITKDEMLELERLRIEMCNNIDNVKTGKTGILWRIIYKNRSFKWFLKQLLLK